MESSDIKSEKPNILFITTDYTRGVDVPFNNGTILSMPTIGSIINDNLLLWHAELGDTIEINKYKKGIYKSTGDLQSLMKTDLGKLEKRLLIL